MSEDHQSVSESEMIAGSALCLVALVVFYLSYLLGRDLGSLIFS
jgi:hypothetical protein